MTVKSDSTRTFMLDGHHLAAEPLTPGLYVTSTPIGNLADITVRALRTLAAADLVLCEDTRVTRKLTRNYGIATPLRAYHDHNAEKVRPDILRQLQAGAAIAQVSDAGTPLVSDPGHKLVRDAVAAGVPVTAVPGASAPLTALAVAGLPTDRVLFAGFPPVKAGQRRTFLEALGPIDATLVLFVSARKLGGVLAEIRSVLGDRRAVIARELTKLHEEVLRGRVSDMQAGLAARPALKGEVTLLLEGSQGGHPSGAGLLDSDIARALETASVRDVATDLAALHDLPRREVYRRALEIARSGADGE